MQKKKKKKNPPKHWERERTFLWEKTMQRMEKSDKFIVEGKG